MIIKHKRTFELLPSISITWLKGYILTLSWGTYTIDIQIKIGYGNLSRNQMASHHEKIR